MSVSKVLIIQAQGHEFKLQNLNTTTRLGGTYLGFLYWEGRNLQILGLSSQPVKLA